LQWNNGHLGSPLRYPDGKSKMRKSNRWLRLACFCAIAIPIHAQAAEPIPIAVLDLDYTDHSGEPRDQRQEHATRLQHFAEALRSDLANSGQYKIVSPICDPTPCTAADPDLIADARKAGAHLIMFGGVQKMSTLIQWAKLLVVDVETEKVVFDRLITFRGDDDESWKRAEAFTIREFTSPPDATR
jgi:hypothetical protein